jgi:hypothetical protein
MVHEQHDRAGVRQISALIPSMIDARPPRVNDVSQFRSFARFGVTLLAAAALLIVPTTATTVSAAKDFDVTGTLDCGIRSG